MTPAERPQEEGDDMIVLGNYTVTIGNEPQQQQQPRPVPQQPIPQPQQPVPQQPIPQTKSTWQKMWPWLLAASIPAAGLGGAAIANYWSKTTRMQDTWVDWDFQAAQPTTTE